MVAPQGNVFKKEQRKTERGGGNKKSEKQQRTSGLEVEEQEVEEVEEEKVVLCGEADIPCSPWRIHSVAELKNEVFLSWDPT